MIKKTSALAISILFFILIISLSIYLSGIPLYFSNTSWSFGFILLIILIYILRYINQIPQANLYSIFYISFLLFIGGRFIATIFNPDTDTFLLDFFITYRLDNLGITKLVFTIIIALTSMELGLYFAQVNKNAIVTQNKLFKREKKLSNIIVLTSILIIVALTILLLKQNLALVSKLGYMALYASQGEAIQASWTSLLLTFTYVFLGITLTHSSKKIKLFYLVLFGINCTIQALMGVRGAIVIYLLFLLWIKHDYGQKQPNLLSLGLFLASILGFLNFILPIFSIRSISTDDSLMLQISSFFYNQGNSLMIFDASTKIDNYSIIPAIQSFLPGSSYLISLINHNLPNYYISFGRYLSYQLNPSLYNQGFGTGWSLLSDFYVFSGGFILLFSAYNFIWGWFINKLEILSIHNQTYKRILITIAPSIIFIPRAGISSIIPLIIYAMVIYIILSGFSKKNQVSKIK